jgi:hypothetical protein
VILEIQVRKEHKERQEHKVLLEVWEILGHKVLKAFKVHREI